MPGIGGAPGGRRGEDEGVVGDLLLDAGGEVAQGHAVGGRVDGHGLGPHTHVELEAGPSEAGVCRSSADRASMTPPTW